MQNWKIKRMSYRQIHAWIIAINKLLAYYEGKASNPIPCPFCRVIWSQSCSNCLWTIFEGGTCIAVGEKILPGWRRNSKKWHILRIPMLKNWKKILKNELARRDA